MLRGNSINLANCNQQFVAEWLQRLQQQGFVQTVVSSTSNQDMLMDDAESAVEVQEFLPEEEIVVFDGSCNTLGKTGT